MMGGLTRTPPPRRSERIRMHHGAPIPVPTTTQFDTRATENSFIPEDYNDGANVNQIEYDEAGINSALNVVNQRPRSVNGDTGFAIDPAAINYSSMPEHLNRTFSMPDLTEHHRQNDVGRENCNRKSTTLSLNHVNTAGATRRATLQQSIDHRPRSTASSTKSAVLKRKRLEVQLEYAKRKYQHQEEMLQLEESLKLAQIEEELDNVSESSKSETSSMRHKMAEISTWVENINLPNINDNIIDIRSRPQAMENSQFTGLLPNSDHNLPIANVSMIKNSSNQQRHHQPSHQQLIDDHQMNVATNRHFSNQSRNQPCYQRQHSIETHLTGNQSNYLQMPRHQSNNPNNLRLLETPRNAGNYAHRDNVFGNESNLMNGAIHHHADQRDKIHHIENWITRQSFNKDLPKFAGNPLEWPQFINQFESTTKLCNLSDAENQIRLQKCLTGQALNIVQPLLIYPHNVSRVVQILKNRFGRTEHIVHLLLDRVRNFNCIKDENDLNCLIDFFDVLSNFIYTLESLDERDHIRNPILYNEVLNKLPMKFKFGFVEYLEQNCTESPPLLTLHGWLERKVSACHKLLIPSISKVRPDSKASKSKPSLNFSIVDDTKKTDPMCLFCNNRNHLIQKCDKFQKASVNERWSFVTKKHACISCLKLNHSLKFCKKRKKCGLNGCEKFHNNLLHNNLPDRTSHVVSPENPITGTNLHVYNDNRISLLKILPVQLKGPNMTLNSFALLDEGSTVTIIDSAVAEELGLDGPSKPLKLQWTNSQFNEQSDSKVVSLGIKSSKMSDKFFTLRYVKTVRDLNLPTQSVNMEKLCHKYSYLKHLKDFSYLNAKPVLIIGQDNWPVMVTRKLVHGLWNGPVASKTLLGWAVHGNICDTDNDISESNDSVFHVHEIDDEEEKDDLSIIQDLLKQQWAFDINGTYSDAQYHPSVEDQYCQEIMKDTICRKGDRFECGLLWKNKNIVLPESKSTALKRLHCLEKKMDKDVNYGNFYTDKMNDYIAKGYLKKVADDELAINNPRVWYLPHFGVVNPNKPGKLRIVFDAAAKTAGKSLNDFLLVGPDLYNLLPDILMNFRIHKYAFIGDIKEMFLQIGVRTEDRYAQRILWRGFDRKNDPSTYEFQVLFFGAKCSPSIAQEVKNRNAKEFISKYPRACHEIQTKHYMDDYLGGADTEEDAINLINDVINVHRKGGFEICNFVTNSRTVLMNIDENLRSKNIIENLNFSSDAEERVLGMWWDYVNDEFLFKFTFQKINPKVLNHEKVPSKRDILKIVMSVFDPLGFISYLIIEGKILMQQIWESGVGWNDEICEHQLKMWISWSSNLKKCSDIRIPRMLCSMDLNSCDIQLHIFSDASQFAYASVGYIRIVRGSNIQCVLVNSKARVAPLKPISIPRLELMAALLGARLSVSIKNSLNLHIDRTILWSDSQIVLSWVKGSSKRFKTFVAQRIGEIHEITQPDCWKYVPSKLNVADQATKIKNIDSSTNKLWFTGPEFLLSSEKDWPKTAKIDVETKDYIEECKTEFCFVINQASEFPIPNVERFSNWLRFVRSVAWVYKFIDKLKCRIRRENSNCVELLPEDILQAENLIFRKIQNDCYSEEIACLKNNSELPKSSPIASFACFVDENGLLRLTGRLSNSTELPECRKFPIILDHSHQIVKLMINHYHRIHNHLGLEHIICSIRDRFWITSIRRAVKYAAYSCQSCRIKKSKIVVPQIGQLPQCRVNRTLRPFIHCGIDYFGPINVTVNRHHEKRYGVVFICMALKAIHIEIAHDLSFNSFMHVFIQFGNRRGFPMELYSDNGKQFSKAAKEINDALDSWPEHELIQFLTHRKCKWNFNAPVAPHTGGLWERMIQQIKRHLANILHDKFPREFVLRTLFSEIEGIINSRPLTFNSSDPNDLEPITPNHFLIGPSSDCFPLVETTDEDLTVLSLWRASQRLADIFWKRWVAEYLPLLMHPNKWRRKTENLSIGDLVLIVDSKTPRNVWPRGMIEKIYLAKDGHVRYIDIKTSVGVYRRHSKYVVKLDLINESNSLDFSN